MMRVADRVVVQFEGEGSGVDKLAWGQQEIWQAMVRQRTWMPEGGVLPLPATRTVGDVAEELRYMMSRYQSLRTRLRFDADGVPSQVVSNSGEIALEIVDALDANPADVADSVWRRYKEVDHDYVKDWPLRMAVVRQGDVLVYLVVVSCHLAADGAGFGVLGREVPARVATPVTGMQPLEQVRWQRSPAGQRQNELALRYWEKHLRTIPVRRLGDSTDKREPRYWHGEFTSRATYLSVQALTERTGVDSASVMLAVYAVALARVTGINPVVTRPVVSNRFRAALAEVVCPLAQTGLCVLDIADVTFDEALLRANRVAMTAYKYAYYDPAQLDELIAKVTLDRGPDFDIFSFYNDRRDGSRRDVMPTREQVYAASQDSTFTWTTMRDDPFERLFVHLDDAPDAVRIAIQMDTHFLSPADGEAFIREMEAVAVEAAYDPAAPTRVGALTA